MNITTKNAFIPLTLISTILISLVFSSLAMGQPKPVCLSPAAAATQIDVEMTATGYPQIKPGSKKNCPDQPASYGADGYFCVDINKQSNMRFHLTNTAATNWKFIGFQLSEGGTEWPGQLPVGVYSDFEFGTENAINNGTPYVKINAAGNMMTVDNNNCHDFTVHYRLIFENAAGDFFRLHPVARNRGTE
jgi:hypothetical protein